MSDRVPVDAPRIEAWCATVPQSFVLRHVKDLNVITGPGAPVREADVMRARDPVIYAGPESKLVGVKTWKRRLMSGRRLK